MGLRRFFLRRKEDADLARELDAHIMHQVDENLAAGMSPDEARRQAYLKLGSPRRVREDVWEWNTLGLAEDVVRNVRHGIRLFWQKPGFAAVSVLTLALGIRATTAIFSAVNPMLFESLPYPRARRPRAVVLSRFCFGISRLDPATYAGVTLLLLGVATLACLAPAWRAARVDPAITLRAE